MCSVFPPYVPFQKMDLLISSDICTKINPQVGFFPTELPEGSHPFVLYRSKTQTLKEVEVVSGPIDYRQKCSRRWQRERIPYTWIQRSTIRTGPGVFAHSSLRWPHLKWFQLLLHQGGQQNLGVDMEDRQMGRTSATRLFRIQSSLEGKEKKTLAHSK